ncbi:glycosyltransferase [Bacillus sp. N9]
MSDLLSMYRIYGLKHLRWYSGANNKRFNILPYVKKANYIYSMADEVIAVSKTYVNRALKVNNKCRIGHDIFLGVELSHFDKLVKENKLLSKPKDEIWVAYIGTLGHSYDLVSVIDALKLLKDRGVTNIKLVVMGEGPLRTRFEEHSNSQGVYAEFTGKLGYAEMVGILSSCDIAVNPIKAGSAGSVINKVGDYSSAGLPVLNTQESIEYRKLVEDNRIGINCINGSKEDLANKLLKLCDDPGLRRNMGINSRRLAEEKFDRGQIYKKL